MSNLVRFVIWKYNDYNSSSNNNKNNLILIAVDDELVMAKILLDDYQEAISLSQ